MKYKCLVCGQIIDNNEMCPFCGSDSSQIVPIDSQGKTGHYRCLVCGRETENGDYCPYCGSQRLYNLDSRKVEDTISINIQNENTGQPLEKPVQNEPYEHVHYENKNSFLFDRPIEATQSQEVLNSQENEQHFGAPRIQNEGEETSEHLESIYFQKYGEMLPLESISNPDPMKVEELYREGLERGYKITPEEVAKKFLVEENENEVKEEEFRVEQNIEFSETHPNDDEENVAPQQEEYSAPEVSEENEVLHEEENQTNEEYHEEQENIEEPHEELHENVSQEETSEGDFEECHECEETKSSDPVELKTKLYAALVLLSLKKTDEITSNLLNLLEEKVKGEVVDVANYEAQKEQVLSVLQDLVDTDISMEEKETYKKYLELLKVLFTK
jgi:DNA-directed RNA polymerase subunit RPC12/RpoP